MADEGPQPGRLRWWSEAYAAARPGLPVAAGVVAGGALLLLGVALGGGKSDHVLPVGTFVAALLAALGALGQLHVARQRHEEQTKADLQRRITESFAKAVEQLGSDKLQVRLGGIYTLERISRESPDDHWTIMETLTGFIRETARWNSADTGECKPRTDVEAALAVIMRRPERSRERERREGWVFDLRSTNLNGVKFHGAHLEGANFEGAHLEAASFMNANLAGANFSETRLHQAILAGARLEGAHFSKAKLERTDFQNANLESAGMAVAEFNKTVLRGARLKGAYLGGARLIGADFGGVSGMVQAQLQEALVDAETILPDGVARPHDWTPDWGEPAKRR